MLRYLVVIGGVLLLAIVGGAAILDKLTTNEPVAVEESSNPSIVNEILFTDGDGYTVHRFYDRGRAHYYVTPGPAVSASANIEGKRSRYEAIHTYQK